MIDSKDVLQKHIGDAGSFKYKVAPCSLSLEYVRSIIDYNPKTGSLTWSDKAHGRSKGKEVGGVNKKGYRTVTIDRKTYQAHRIAWYIETGFYPDQMIGFVNNNKLDLRADNLVRVTQSTKHKVNKNG